MEHLFYDKPLILFLSNLTHTNSLETTVFVATIYLTMGGNLIRAFALSVVSNRLTSFEFVKAGFSHAIV